MTAVLEARGLRVVVNGVTAVDGVDLELREGSRTGLIGESGSGKSLTALAMMGLLPEGVDATGSVAYREQELLGMRERDLCRLRGDRLAMVFQEPMTALNPVMRIGDQVAEAIRLHRPVDGHAARAEAERLLTEVHLPDPAGRMRAYPHQLSGGQRQRVMIAMALACGPDVIIADEPTTALDVSVQAQILALLRELVEARRMTLLLITHDLPVVAATCENVMVMYGGRIVESGRTADVFGRPRHPYTRGLVDAIPDAATPPGALRAIPGTVPGLGRFPSGCVFRDRCWKATDKCHEEPSLTKEPQAFACWHPIAGGETAPAPQPA